MFTINNYRRCIDPFIDQDIGRFPGKGLEFLIKTKYVLLRRWSWNYH
jgi:hypothetical protein